ncbi:rRNA biogenesis protein rrp5 [Bacillaceae bacterium IKA-2]|nr:rRNA biogenesis protein rrp5 [Bacillaceae bacterium IKA-2]
MSKIKLALEVVEDLRTLAASVESLANAMQSNEPVPVEKQVEIPKVEPITIEKVRAVLAEKSQGGKQPEVKALITKFGAKKLTDIDPTCYEQLLAEAQVL